MATRHIVRNDYHNYDDLGDHNDHDDHDDHDNHPIQVEHLDHDDHLAQLTYVQHSTLGQITSNSLVLKESNAAICALPKKIVWKS